MQTQVFLSLDHSDADFVASVHSRLPIGMAIFYERSFENFENMLSAMDRTTSRAQIFAFFVNKNTSKSKAVQFEMAEARKALVFRENIKIAVFPTDNEITFRNLPPWMQERWIPKAGYNANDIARYITSLLLDSEIEREGIKVSGRGKSLDHLDAVSADFLQRHRKAPNVYVLAGVSGIGRRTFATYYARNSMDALPNLNFGPLLILPDQAELEDVYRSVRQEVRADSSDVIASDVEMFRKLDDTGKFSEIARLLAHFADLGQAVRIVSTSGFFEDDGRPKFWALDFIRSIPDACIAFIVSNRQFDPAFIAASENSVQLRVEELADRDIRSLMVRTADRLKVENFEISDALVAAIGGHPDVANAAVSIARQRGTDILNRDPVYLYNIQQTILGSLVTSENLSDESKVILDALSWVPELGSDILFEIFKRETGQGDSEFVATCQSLVDGCVIVPRGYSYQISSSVRHLYRRWNVTSSDRLNEISAVLQDRWEEAERRGQFREDLFEAFVFMYALTGADLPEELRRLLSPGTLASVVRETYARGKSEDDRAALDRVVKWGSIAESMEMSDATREEILGTVGRAYIRARKVPEAQAVIDQMRSLGFESTDFLQGHLYRKDKRFEDAVPYLEAASKRRKFNRSAVHELALAYQGAGQNENLGLLWDKFGDKIRDSAMFLDFEIARDIRDGKTANILAKIRRLRALPDDEGRADLREAQVQLHEGRFGEAKDFLSICLDTSLARPFHILTLRCKAAIRDRDYSLARKDIDRIFGMAGRRELASSLEAEFAAHQGKFEDARKAMHSIGKWTPFEWRQYARILEMEVDEEPSLARKNELAVEAGQIFEKYGAYVSSEYNEM